MLTGNVYIDVFIVVVGTGSLVSLWYWLFEYACKKKGIWLVVFLVLLLVYAICLILVIGSA